MPKPIVVPFIGAQVHYVLSPVNDGSRTTSAGQHRPATVVRIWPNSAAVQLVVLMDCTNDRSDGALTFWATSVVEDGTTFAPRTWHWPEQ